MLGTCGWWWLQAPGTVQPPPGSLQRQGLSQLWGERSSERCEHSQAGVWAAQPTLSRLGSCFQHLPEAFCTSQAVTQGVGTQLPSTEHRGLFAQGGKGF